MRLIYAKVFTSPMSAPQQSDESAVWLMSNANEHAPYLRLLAEQYPGYVVSRCESAQQGWDSVTLLINGDTIFRFARRPDVAMRLAREATLLPDLAPTLPLGIPHFDFIAETPTEGVRFVGYRSIPGEALRLCGMGMSSMHELARALGEFLSALHRFPTAEAQYGGVLGGGTEDWRREYQDRSSEVRQYVLPLLTSPEQRAVASFWDGYLDDATNFDFAPVLIHRDLSDEHILMDPETSKLTGVIDWGDVSIGDPAIDFAGLYNALGEPFARLVFDAYAGDERHEDAAFWRRVRFYAEIVPFYEIIFGRLEGDEGHVEHGLAALRRTMSGW
jgi:aminoglycoside 2''-phosphotransferase